MAWRSIALLALGVALLLGDSRPAAAQVPDTTGRAPAGRVAADSSAGGEGVPAAPPPWVGFGAPEPGTSLVDSLPAREPVIEAAELLARLPGSFVYAFGVPGWPDGWSPYGLPPHQVELILDGRPFGDLVTGRPRFDLLPLGYVAALRVLAQHHGGPLAVQAHTRPYDAPRPFTELRYWAGANALQSIEAVHTQQRRRSLFGRPGLLGLLGGYVGRASAGPYGEATRLRRERKVLARLRYEQARWAVELSNLHNRRRVGAYGGVQPLQGFGLESIYLALEPDLVRPAARRQTLRNDLALTGRLRLRPEGPPLTGTLYWTAQTLRYGLPSDTLTATADRLGFRAAGVFGMAGRRPGLRLEGWLDRVRVGEAGPGAAWGELHAGVRDTVRLAGMEAALDAGAHLDATGPFPTASLHLQYGPARRRLFVRASYAGQPVPFVARYGLGPYLHPAEAVPSGRVVQGEAGFVAERGPFSLRLFGFAGRTSAPLDYHAAGHAAGVPDADGLTYADTAFARVGDAPRQRLGAGAEAGWRRNARRGFYAVLQPTLLREHTDAVALPRFFARGRFGMRYALFRGDLDFDLYLQGRFWDAFQSRVFHAPSGLLVLPPGNARFFGPASLLDVFFTARVRTATVFIVYEHALGGTTLQAGTLLVPVYPLPPQRFRFGVYWPILD